METLPKEIKLQEFWKFLSYYDIVHLCQSNSEFSQICLSNELWVHLLQKDFNICDHDNAKQLYLKYRHTLDHFTQYYPIITNHALKSLVHLISLSDWPIIDKTIITQRKEGDTNQLLTEQDVSNLISSANYYEYANYNVNEFDKNSHDIIYNSVGGKAFFNKMVVHILKTNCEQLLKYATKPTIIFVYGQLTDINYDIDLASYLKSSHILLSFKCDKLFYQLRNDILTLL